MGSFIARYLAVVSLTATLISAPFYAMAEETENQDVSSKTWFVEGRYQKSISESTVYNDKDTSSTRVVSVTGEKLEGLESTGIAIGRFFDKW